MARSADVAPADARAVQHLLRDAAHRSPHLQRCPDRMFEAEAVERCRCTDRWHAEKFDAGPLKSAFLQHPAGERIADAGACMQHPTPEISERVINQGPCRFRGVAVAPMPDTHPESKFGSPPVDTREGDDADDHPFARFDDERALIPGPLSDFDDPPGVTFSQKVGKARKVLCDFPVAGETG